MLEKLMIVSQSLTLLAACCLIFAFLNTDQGKRISELELRQTNHLAFLEQKTNNVDAKLDAAVNRLEQRLYMLSAKQDL
jgi:hypothetical protein